MSHDANTYTFAYLSHDANTYTFAYWYLRGQMALSLGVECPAVFRSGTYLGTFRPYAVALGLVKS